MPPSNLSPDAAAHRPQAVEEWPLGAEPFSRQAETNGEQTAWRVGGSARGLGGRVRGVRTAVVLALALGFLAGSAGAQTQPGKVFRIGTLLYVIPVSRQPNLPSHQVFVGALRQLGYEEGRNLVLEMLSAEGQAERLPALAAELVRGKPDGLVAGTCGPALDALRQATRTSACSAAARAGSGRCASCPDGT